MPVKPENKINRKRSGKMKAVNVSPTTRPMSKACNLSPTATPMSQASTAPGTPMFWLQADSLEDSNRTSPRKFKAKMKQTMSQNSTTVAEHAVYDSEDDGFDCKLSKVDCQAVCTNEYGQLVDEDGMAWVEVTGPGAKKQKEDYNARLESLEKSLQDAKGLFKAKTGEDVDEEDSHVLFPSPASTPGARQAKRMRLGPQHEPEVTQIMNGCSMHHAMEEPGPIDADGTLWTQIQGEGALKPHSRYMAKLNSLETTLAECKDLYKKKTGMDVDEDDAFMCDDDGTLWISVTGQGAYRPRHLYLTRIEDLQDQLGEAKLLFKNRYGHDIDVEDQDEALLFVKRSSSMSTSRSPQGSPKRRFDILEMPGSPARRAAGLQASPALSSDGLVMELQTGAAVFLPYQRVLAQGEFLKRSLKEDLVAMKALKLAHSACAAEEKLLCGAACAVDSNGCLHGQCSATWSGLSKADRMKLLYLKRQARNRSEKDSLMKPQVILAVSPGGSMYFVPKLYLELHLKLLHAQALRSRRQRALREVCMQQVVTLSRTTAVVDARGVIRYFCI